MEVIEIIEIIIAIIHPIFICAFLGFGSDKGMYPWYGQLKRPSYTPPDWMFQIVWMYLYTSMGYAAYLVWKTEGDIRSALLIYLIQLFINGTWSQTFFNCHLLGWGAIHMGVMWIFVLITMRAFFAVNYTAGMLIVPYLAWMTFAVFLCYTFWILNSNKKE
jgi:translocator protein